MESITEGREIEELRRKIIEIETEQSKLVKYYRNEIPLFNREHDYIGSDIHEGTMKTDEQKYEDLERQKEILKDQIRYIQARPSRDREETKKAVLERNRVWAEACERYKNQSIFKRAIQYITGKSFYHAQMKDLTNEEVERLYR